MKLTKKKLRQRSLSVEFCLWSSHLWYLDTIIINDPKEKQFLEIYRRTGLMDVLRHTDDPAETNHG